MYEHEWLSEVKDSELDALRVVNNANYFIYCEHARHLYVKSLGLSFSSLLDSGYKMIILNSQMKFKSSLVAEDQFQVKTTFSFKRVRLLINQKIYRPSDRTLILESDFQGTGILEKTGKVSLPPSLTEAIERANKSKTPI